jgi:serine/threonine protein kinase
MPQKLLHYDVLERLGEGARSTIYSVRDPETRQLYAMKHVVRVQPKDLRFIEQMETEFEVSRQFTHINLRRSYDLKISKTLLLKVSEAFLLMELVDGKPLDVQLPDDLLAITDTFIQAAHGLKAMHSMGIAHCDIKPNNILRNERGQVKIIDFGQSCRIGTQCPDRRVQSWGDAVLGGNRPPRPHGLHGQQEGGEQLPAGRPIRNRSGAEPQDPAGDVQPGHGLHLDSAAETPHRYG